MGLGATVAVVLIALTFECKDFARERSNGIINHANATKTARHAICSLTHDQPKKFIYFATTSGQKISPYIASYRALSNIK